MEDATPNPPPPPHTHTKIISIISYISTFSIVDFLGYSTFSPITSFEGGLFNYQRIWSPIAIHNSIYLRSLNLFKHYNLIRLVCLIHLSWINPLNYAITYPRSCIRSLSCLTAWTELLQKKEKPWTGHNWEPTSIYLTLCLSPLILGLDLGIVLFWCIRLRVKKSHNWICDHQCIVQALWPSVYMLKPSQLTSPRFILYGSYLHFSATCTLASCSLLLNTGLLLQMRYNCRPVKMLLKSIWPNIA